MNSTKALVSSIQDELKGLTGAIGEVMTTFKKMQEPIAESRQKVPEATKQLEKISEQTEEAAHQMIDKVESISKVSEEIVSDITVLRKTLPATYFKNRSKIRDTVNAIDEKSQQNLDDAFVILNALQFQDITTQQIQHASTLMEEIENRLHHILAVFDGKEDIEELRAIMKKRVYDPNASFSDSKETQDDIDSLISSLKDES
jgi:chemotaxis regulatin CheY-phosphate phosphatase CheZ